MGLNTSLQPALLEMHGAGGKKMLQADLDGGPVASRWGRLMGDGGGGLKPSSAPET